MVRYNLTMTKLPAYRQVFFRYLKLLLISVLIVVEILNISFMPNTLALDLNSSDEIAKEIEKLSRDLKSSQDATVPLEQKLKSLNGQITSIQTKINKLTSNIGLAEKQIKQKEADLDKQKKILAATVRSYYIKTFVDTPLLTLLSSDNATDVTRELTFRAKTADRDKNLIISITGDITGLKKEKEDLAKEKIKSAGLQASLNKEADFYKKEVSGAKKYQSSLSNQIVSLTARQNEILAQKLGSLNLPSSLGAGPLSCTDDRKLDPGFGNAFAFFTFGIPHRVGMNQYGAWGRAKAGQSAEQILQAYFQNFEFQTGKENETIKVNGKNEFGQTFDNETMSIEEYMKHVHEMPTSWTDNDSAALKAQAIAARSYALKIMQDKGYILPSQSDQVIKKEVNSSNWINAVEATKGKIMTNGGSPIKAWFASTSGGYTFTSADVCGGNTAWTKRLRDTNGDIGSFDELLSKSYDKDSKCLYAAQGYRSQYGNSAWLKSEEVADIVNTLLLVKSDSSSAEHLYQTDKSNPAGTDNWDANKVKDELKSKGGSPYGSVSSVSIDWDKSIGVVNTITINGDAGSQNFSGREFKDRFNLRAPANIQIVGGLFNVEKK